MAWRKRIKVRREVTKLAASEKRQSRVSRYGKPRRSAEVVVEYADVAFRDG
jgi:hypothetical protein